MPFEADGERRSARRLEVRPSAVSELAWLQYNLAEDKDILDVPGLDGFRQAAPGLARELADLWGDGFGCLPEVTVLAARIDALLTDEADTFLQGLQRAAYSDAIGLELLSESPEDRDATLARLARLRRDSDSLRRFTSVSSRMWELVREEWETHGRQAVAEACSLWTDRIARGATVRDLLPEVHPLKRPHHEKHLALMERRPAVVISPLYFAAYGGFFIDLTSYVHVGTPAGPIDAERQRRKEAELVAANLKVLSDGTRVALLRHLTAEPATVMDLARRFRLAQPTVSNHVRMLRDAGLLDATRDGARVLYRAPRQRVAQLLAETQRLLVD